MATVTLDPPTVETDNLDTPEAPATHTFDAVRLPVLDAELARLNKIAKKLGVDTLTYTIVERGIREKKVDTDEFGVFYLDKVIEIETVTVIISGTTPMLPGGWKFLGSVEFLPDAEDGTKLAMVHGDDPRLAPYRDAGPVCDHCGYRRNRKKIVVLENSDAEITVVGSSCLKDFLGYHGNPERVLNFYDDLDDVLGDLDDEGGGGHFGGSYDRSVPTDLFLATTVAFVRRYGWVPKSSWDGEPTAGRLGFFFFPPFKLNDDDRKYLMELRAVEITDDDLAKAKEVRAWAKEAFTERPDNNYLGNLVVALAGSYVADRHFGIAASAVGAYDKALGFEVERRNRKAEAAKSDWVGEIGKRDVYTGTVAAVIPYESMYGSGRIVKLVDADGNIIKSLTTGAWAFDLVVGAEVTVKATVKAHETWNGAKETLVSRAALFTPKTKK